ncbi:serine hydrolase domain-containing protein [Streptomyces mirabilis]|uniref:serine hydrolase domain-containing protein n=1 Tax=Streptomyces mirabilis TaxID=68239 RepID=UPI003808C9D9
MNRYASQHHSSVVTGWRGDDAARVQEVLDRVVAQGVPGAVAVVWDARSGVHPFTSGSAGVSTGRPPTVEDRFRIGSITKMFLATVVLQLAGEGKLSLEDKLSRWLPDVVRDADTITLRQILQHTAGIDDFVAHLRFNGESLFHEHTPGDLIKLVADKPLISDPAQQHSYSNTGYVLAGLLIERVTGRGWRTEVQDRLIAPLGLQATSMPLRQTGIVGPHLSGYHSDAGVPEGPRFDVTELSPTMADAAGEIISDAQDLITFARALFGGQLLHASLLAQMTETVPSTEPMDAYGLGLVRSDLACGASAWGHGGKIPGFSAWLAANAEATCVVAAATNQIPADTTSFYRHLLDAVFSPVTSGAPDQGDGPSEINGSTPTHPKGS